MQPTPSPISTSEAPAFFFTTRPDFFATATDHTPCGNFFGVIVTAAHIEESASAGGFGIVGVPRLVARGQQLFDFGRNRLAFDLHPLHGLGDAGGVPQLERSHLPVEAELHGAIDLDHRVGNLANAVGGVGPQIGQRRPEKDAGFVLRRRQQHLEALGQVVDRLRHLQRRETSAAAKDDIPSSSSRARRFRFCRLSCSCGRSRPWSCRPATCAPASAGRSWAAPDRCARRECWWSRCARRGPECRGRRDR